MENKEQLFDKIEDFLRGKLPEEERRAFEQQLASDPELAGQVELHRFEQEGLEYLLEEDLRRKMQAWRQEGPPKKGNGPGWRLWMIPLAILCLAGLFFFLRKPGPPSEPGPAIEEQQQPAPSPLPAPEAPAAPSEPMAKDARPETGPPKAPAQPSAPDPFLALANDFYDYQLPADADNLRGEEGEEEPSALDAGIKAFRDGEYSNAIRELSKAAPEDGGRAYELAQELLAHAYFKEKQFSRAADFFRPFAGAPGTSPVIKDWAEWYLLLNLLPGYAANREEVNRLLKIMTENPRHTYHDKALRLKVKLDAIR